MTMSDNVDDNGDNDGDGNSDGNDGKDSDGGDGDNDKGEVEHDGGDNNDNDDNDDNDDNNDVNIDVVEDNGNDGTTTMRWRRGRMDNDDAMAMGGQRPAECLRVPRHPSEATINLCRQFGEESTRERDNFFGGGDRKGLRWRRLSGDHFISTQSIPNLPSGYPSAEKGPEPIPHVSWE
jgi:hypothetical protein